MVELNGQPLTLDGDRYIVEQDGVRLAISLAEGFHRETASIAMSSREQQRLITTLQQQSINVLVRHPSFDWWPRFAWIGASAVLIVGLFFLTRFSFSPTVRAPQPGRSRLLVDTFCILKRLS